LLDQLKTLDTELFLFLNSRHNSFFDFIMYWASNKWVWIPFYIWLLFLLFKSFGKKTILIALLAGAMIFLSDQVSSHLIKDLVQRPRPSHEAALAGQVHLVYEYSGGPFGFISSHAANSFALCFFLVLVSMRKLRGMKVALWCYAFLISYSRIYLGVHYPGDVLGGIVLGLLLGALFASIYQILIKKLNL